ncbi:MAG: efflux RND transporter periplasmic adaptor subunit [Pseudomonadota bacterium]|nr:efflux RND transporter periplasmic adaptor subunit [Pseudomonadota bacterium]
MQTHSSATRLAVRTALLCALGATPGAQAADVTVQVQTIPVQRGSIAQPVRGYGVVAAAAANLTSVNVSYVARIEQLRVQAGQKVSRGDPLFVVQADPAAALAATQAKSALTLAEGELARTQALFDQSLATASQLATAKKAKEDARQALAAQIGTGVGNGNTIVKSPVDGVVIQVTAGQGDQVAAGAPILQLAASNSRDALRSNVTLGVEPSEATSIHSGDAVTLHGLSTSLANTAVTGRVVLVGASIDTQTQLLDIGAAVPISNTPLIPGTKVSGDIATRTGVHWIVPRAAVLKDDKHAYVYQLTKGNKARRIDVATVVETGNRYGVDGALDAALPLIVSGNYELKDGMAVAVAGGAAR